MPVSTSFICEWSFFIPITNPWFYSTVYLRSQKNWKIACSSHFIYYTAVWGRCIWFDGERFLSGTPSGEYRLLIFSEYLKCTVFFFSKTYDHPSNTKICISRFRRIHVIMTGLFLISDWLKKLITSSSLHSL